jgi:hypothetical protein
MVMALFLLSHEKIDQIKEGTVAMADAKALSFVATSAFAWVCLLKFGSDF